MLHVKQEHHPSRNLYLQKVSNYTELSSYVDVCFDVYIKMWSHYTRCIFSFLLLFVLGNRACKCAYLLNKQSRTPEKSSPPFRELGELLTTPHRNVHTTLRTWTDSLVRPKKRKSDMRFGTWNFRRLYRAGSLYSKQPGT